MPTKPQPVEFPRFVGLDLRDDPQEVGAGAAIDGANFDLDVLGRLRARDGYTALTSASSQYAAMIAFRGGAGAAKLIADDTFGGQLTAFTSAGAVIASSAGTASRTFATGMAAIGTSSASYVYCQPSSGGNARRFDGAAWTSVALKNCRFLAVQPTDNRLVCAADFGTSLSRVWFSDAGAPENFGANNWVDLHPGDGEVITAMAVFGNQLYVFKQSKFFVFYGNQTDGSGNPVFNYRTVTGIGAIYSEGSAVAGSDGVYFISSDGIYRTTGGQAVRLSTPVDPLFTGVGSSYWTGDTVGSNAGTGRLGASRNRVYFSYSNGSAYRTLIWDIRIGGWLYWDMPATHITELPGAAGVGGTVVFSRLDSAANIMAFSTAATTDNGSAISAHYRPGFWNPGQPGSEAWVREILLDGTGTVTVKTAINDTVTLGTGQAVTLGTAPAVAQGRDRRGLRGRNVSYDFSGTAPWSLSRVTPLLWGQTSPGAKAA